MPAATVTLRWVESSSTTWSMAFNESRFCLLSAILLKQWRVPRTFSLLSRLTNSRTWSTELAGYRRSVLYSRLPAQFFSLSPRAQASRGESARAAIIAERTLRKDLLSMAGYAVVVPPKPPGSVFRSGRRPPFYIVTPVCSAQLGPGNPGTRYSRLGTGASPPSHPHRPRPQGARTWFGEQFHKNSQRGRGWLVAQGGRIPGSLHALRRQRTRNQTAGLHVWPHRPARQQRHAQRRRHHLDHRFGERNLQNVPGFDPGRQQIFLQQRAFLPRRVNDHRLSRQIARSNKLVLRQAMIGSHHQHEFVFANGRQTQAVILGRATENGHLQLPRQQGFGRAAGCIGIDGDFDLGIFLVKAFQQRGQPVIARVALGGQPDHPGSVSVEIVDPLLGTA